jgi:hypothetical protein
MGVAASDLCAVWKTSHTWKETWVAAESAARVVGRIHFCFPSEINRIGTAKQLCVRAEMVQN